MRSRSHGLLAPLLASRRALLHHLAHHRRRDVPAADGGHHQCDRRRARRCAEPLPSCALRLRLPQQPHAPRRAQPGGADCGVHAIPQGQHRDRGQSDSRTARPPVGTPLHGIADSRRGRHRSSAPSTSTATASRRGSSRTRSSGRASPASKRGCPADRRAISASTTPGLGASDSGSAAAPMPSMPISSRARSASRSHRGRSWKG